jgi:outer membrane receptor protein involved in Fe transport
LRPPTRLARRATITTLVVALGLLLACGVPARAQSATTARVEGVVDDAATGLPVGGATIALVDRASTVTAANDGSFRIADLAPGVYRLRIERAGYQPALSGDVVLVAGSDLHVTLALQRATSSSALRVIGATATNAAAALLRTTTTTRTLTVEALEAQGVTRAGDALRELPGITNGIPGDTASFGDDIPLQLRGIGTLETTTTIDGHPIAYGFPGSYNFQISPISAFRDVGVTYGSGSNVLGTSAIGGVIDFRTLVPTPDLRITIGQGAGTFQRLATTLRATGTTGKLGYALAYGASGLDGQFSHVRYYQPAAAYDVTATAPAVRAIGTYDMDASANAHSGLVKLRYSLGPSDAIVATGVLASYFENKTGNGDGDFLEAAPATAFAQQALAKYTPSGANPCPSGSFAVANGGHGPGGAPDGGSPCATVAQYVADTVGFQGAGPAFQTFNLFDGGLAYEHASANRFARVAVFGNRYDDFTSRQYRLPYTLVPGDNFSIAENRENEGGLTASEDFAGRNNTAGVGYTYLNAAFALAKSTSTASSYGAPTVHQQSYELRDVYRAPGSPLSLYANAALTQASATHSTALDPRFSVLYQRPSSRDVLRVSAGATTTQPSGDELGQPFVPQQLGSAGGGGGIRCGGLNSIGSVPSSALHPERGVDEEVAYAHGFGGDAYVEATLYNVNVLNKLYKTIVPLSSTGSGFVDPAFLAQQTQLVANACGAAAAPALIGVTGTYNVGRLRAQGITLAGRYRLDRRTALDYDWTLDSTTIVSVPTQLLQSNFTLVPGSQLPGLPLHTLDIGLNRLVGSALDVRFTLHGVSDNNTKRLPAYTYSDLKLSVRLPRGTLALEIDNLFNQFSDPRGLLYEGEPYALNSYATAAQYAPYTGAAASERFGLPGRALFVDYVVRVR